MAKIDIPRLVIRSRRSGKGILCYWVPSATLQNAGWEMSTLGSDLDVAIAKAKALNAQVEEWRDGGTRPRQVKAFIKNGTVAQLIARFEAERFPALEESTRKTYRWAFGVISRWAGGERVDHIDRARVRKLRQALLKPDPATGEQRLNRASGIMRVARSLFDFAADGGLVPEGWPNPFREQNMPTPPPRDQIWPAAAVDLFVEAAEAIGQPGLALAILLGRDCAQREGDLLAFSLSRWTVIPRHKFNPEDFERLAEPGPDGTRDVRGLRVRQGKTKRWVEIPIVGTTRRLVEENAVRARAHRSAVLLLERQEAEEGERWVPWHETRFQRAIASLRSAAAKMATDRGDDELATAIVDLQFRDLRRTAVVWLGELGIEDHLIAAITGHKLDTTRKILETYMPRTTKMAGKAIALRIERDGVPDDGAQGGKRGESR